MTDTKVVDAEGNTIEEGAKFHITGMEQFTGVVEAIVGPDEGQWPRVKVKYDQSPFDVEYLPCNRIGPHSEIYCCSEVMVWQE